MSKDLESIEPAAESPLSASQSSHLAERDRRFKDVLLPRITLLFSTAALTLSVIGVTKGPQGIDEIVNYLRREFSNIVIGANILVSVIAAIYLVRQRSVRLVVQDKEKFRSLAELGTDVNIETYTANLNNRVEQLVSQYKLHLSLFALSLVLVYTIIALTKYTGHEDRSISYFTITTNLINLVGALFVHCGFIVLYNKTLVAEVASSKEEALDATEQFKLETTQNINYYANLYWALPVLLVIPYTLILIALAVAKNYDGGDQETFLNIADLFAGSYNGLAMSLLFGRYVSIEQSVRNTNRYAYLLRDIFYPFSSKPYKSLVTIGIVFILPIYALAQPLFGNLQLSEFGDPKVFQTCVFGVCLLGKICFFHLSYLLIGKRILHLYLYGMAANIGNFKELESCFDKSA